MGESDRRLREAISDSQIFRILKPPGTEYQHKMRMLEGFLGL